MPTDPERLGALVEALSEGRRVDVSEEDAADIAEALAAELDGGIEARAELARRQGLTIACGPGCTGCCEVVVMVHRPEAMAVARFLERPENAAARAQFMARYQAWKAGLGDLPERLSTLSKGDRRHFDALLVEAWGRRVLCAFNQDGLCTIYPVRPLGCRNTHALDTPDRCRADSEKPAAALAFKPLDEFLANAVGLLRATHEVVGDKGRLEALCTAVYGLLDRNPSK